MNDEPNPYDAPNAPLDDPPPKRSEPRRFSFMTLVVVLGIIGVLVALLL